MSLEPEREREEEEHENTERWLISYSDFLTLLFTFFVALYALSVIDQNKAESFSESLRQVFRVIDDPIKIEREKSQLVKELETLLKDFQGTFVKEEYRGTVITLPDSLLFDSGSAELKPQSKEILTKLAEKLKGMPNKISVEGHTDNVPIRSDKIRSNWELSTLRALSVVHFLIETGISPDRLSATGYGEYRNIADNNTAEGRAKNRRVEIVLLRQGRI